MGTSSNGKVKFTGVRAKKRNDLVSAEERMALRVGPQAELMQKKRNENELMQLLIDNEDAILQKQLLKKLEENILIVSETSLELMNSAGEVHYFTDQNLVEEEAIVGCTANNETRMSPKETDKDELNELRNDEVEVQTQNQQPDNKPIEWILRIVDGIANPISRFPELEYRNKKISMSKSNNKTKSVKLNFSQCEENQINASADWQQIPTSSGKNCSIQNTKDDGITPFNSDCEKDDANFEMNEEEQLMSMLDLAYNLDGNIINEVMSTIDKTLNGKCAVDELSSTSDPTSINGECAENGNSGMICTSDPTLKGDSFILEVPFSPIRRDKCVDEMDDGEIVGDNQNDSGGDNECDRRAIVSQQQKSKEFSSVQAEESEGNDDDAFVPEPMTPPRPTTPADCETGIPSPKTPPPVASSHPTRIKEVIEMRENERTVRLLDIITLDCDDEW